MRKIKLTLFILFISIFLACSDNGTPISPNNHNGNGTPTTEPQLYYSKDFNLFSYNVETDSITQITTGSRVGDIAAAPDGKYVAFIDNYHLYLYDTTSLTINTLETVGEVNSPSFFPSGDSIAYIVREGSTTYHLKLVDLNTGESTTLLTRGTIVRMIRVSPNGKYFAYLGPVFPGAAHIVDMATLTEIDFVPPLPTDIGQFEWQNENTIILATGTGIYSVNIEQRNWSTISSRGEEPIATCDSVFAFIKERNLYLQSGAAEELIYTPNGSIRKLAFSPSGNYIALIEYSAAEYHLELYSFQEDTVKVIESGGAYIYTLDW